MLTTESQRACWEIGRMVHHAAVRVEVRNEAGNLVSVGSKSELGRRAGVDKEKVQFVTRGEGHKLHPSEMRAVIMACEREVGGPNVGVMLQLSERILYSPEPGRAPAPVRVLEVIPSATRVENPLTYAERRI